MNLAPPEIIGLVLQYLTLKECMINRKVNSSWYAEATSACVSKTLQFIPDDKPICSNYSYSLHSPSDIEYQSNNKLLLAIQKTDAYNKEVESCQDGYRKTPYYPNEQGLIIQVEDPLKCYSDIDQFTVQHHDKFSEMSPDHVAFLKSLDMFKERVVSRMTGVDEVAYAYIIFFFMPNDIVFELTFMYSRNRIYRE
jgi:hypothetical protein